MRKARVSAGILLYRIASELQVFLIHPGGPYFQNKDVGAWSIPKGEIEDEDPLDAARREFKEETGFDVDGKLIELHPILQAGGKTVFCWAGQGDLDPAQVRSNEFEMEWPPRSGLVRRYPEVDRADWFGVDAARQRLNPAQVGLLEQLIEIIGKGAQGE